MSSTKAFSTPRYVAAARLRQHPLARTRIVARADPDEEEFEARLARINKSKVPTGVSRKELRASGSGMF